MAFSLNDYTDIEEIARGGMGKVYLATQISLSRKVIVKEMSTGLLANEAEVRRFENEARAAAALDHDAIIRIYDFGEDRGSFYISMEYIDGPSLDSVLKETQYLPEIGLLIVLQALKGLHFAHQHQIIHRDIKPGNILISKVGAVKVVDFGLAHAVKRPLNLTTTDMIIGTPLFMSPEQATGEENKDLRMDVWAVGVLLYRITTGEYPFGGNNVPAILFNIMQTKEVPVEDAAPALPDDLAAKINRCLEKDRSKRLGSLAPLIESLQNYFYDIGIKDTDEQIRKYVTDRPSCVNDLRKQLCAFHSLKARTYEAAQATSKAQAHLHAANKFDPAYKLGFKALDGVKKHAFSILAASRTAQPSAAPAAVGRQSKARKKIRVFITFFILASILGGGISALSHRPKKIASLQPTPTVDQRKELVRGAFRDARTISAETLQEKARAPDNSKHHERVTSPYLQMRNTAGPAAPVRSKMAFAPLPHPADQGAGILKIILNPATAAASVDGEEISQAQASGGKVLKPGTHTLKATAAGFAPYSKTVTIESGAVQIMSVDLTSLQEQGMAAVHVHSYPWAEIFIDGVFQGNSPSPKPIPLTEGTHSVALKRDGYKTYEETIKVTKGELRRIKVQLEGK